MSPLTPYLQLRTDQVVRGVDIATSLPTLAWLAALGILFSGLSLLLIWAQARPAPAAKGDAA
jgi:ABC-2 type transport system permease protein